MNTEDFARYSSAVLICLLACFGCSREGVPSGESDLAGSGTNAAMLIIPGEAVGPIHAGMTVEDVVRLLGEPQLTTEHAFEYTKRGFAILPRTGPVQAVVCGDVTGLNGPLVSIFKGRTKEGIGLKSTREELVKAYGDPAETHNLFGGTESMLYPNLGMTFMLQGGKIYHMTVRLTGTEQPGRAVNIDLAPPTNK